MLRDALSLPTEAPDLFVAAHAPEPRWCAFALERALATLAPETTWGAASRHGGDTALHVLVAERRSPEAAALLLAGLTPADVNLRSKARGGHTPMHAALSRTAWFHEHIPVHASADPEPLVALLRLLVRHGADALAKDDEGRSALNLARVSRQPTVRAWAAAYGRFLGRFRVKHKPLHGSETCRAHSAAKIYHCAFS